LLNVSNENFPIKRCYEKGATFQGALKRYGITESDIFQMQLVIQDNKI